MVDSLPSPPASPANGALDETRESAPPSLVALPHSPSPTPSMSERDLSKGDEVGLLRHQLRLSRAEVLQLYVSFVALAPSRPPARALTDDGPPRRAGSRNSASDQILRRSERRCVGSRRPARPSARPRVRTAARRPQTPTTPIDRRRHNQARARSPAPSRSPKRCCPRTASRCPSSTRRRVEAHAAATAMRASAARPAQPGWPPGTPSLAARAPRASASRNPPRRPRPAVARSSAACSPNCSLAALPSTPLDNSSASASAQSSSSPARMVRPGQCNPSPRTAEADPPRAQRTSRRPRSDYHPKARVSPRRSRARNACRKRPSGARASPSRR